MERGILHMKRFASLLIGFLLLFNGQGSAATLQDAGLSGKLPLEWKLNQEEKGLFVLSDKSDFSFCIFYKDGQNLSDKEIEERFEYQISTAKEADGFIPSSLNADFKNYNGRKTWVLTSQSKVANGKKAYYATIIWRENNFFYTALFWAYNEQDSFDFPKIFFDSLDEKLATLATKSSPNWVEPQTSFVFPCPDGWAIVAQDLNFVLFKNQADPKNSLKISVKPLEGSAFSGISNRAWPGYLEMMYDSGFSNVTQFKTAKIWTSYAERDNDFYTTSRAAHFDYKKRSFYLIWTGPNSSNDRDIFYNYLDQLVKPKNN